MRLWRASEKREKRMSLYTVSSGQVINANDINQLVNALQVPSGGSEVWQYFLAGLSNAQTDVISNWITTRNHGTAPSSVTLDHSILSPIGYSSYAAGNLQGSGFQAFGYADSSAPNHNCHVGGNYTAAF
jgi:hypothetical protein